METCPLPPQWEVLVLVSQHLDPQTLAIASCVSKSWLFSMSCDHLWKPILTTHFPSLSTLTPAVPFQRLFAIGHSAAKRRRKNPSKSKPKLSLSDLVFAVTLSSHESSCVVTITKPCDTLLVDPPGVFRFDVDVMDEGFKYGSADLRKGLEGVKVTWNVILKGWKEIFTMMDCEGNVGFVTGSGEGWFAQELPTPGCCSNAAASTVEADLKLQMCDGRESDGKVRVKKVNLGIMNVVNWRYVSVEDGLRYLEHFLLTCNEL
ncbi:hypothetical protein TanjilG_23168 [Lupinus angustifolius]|uniref:F-box protein n=1 Tax=Lupinus angustifolius TaxID=3871 RepID=A0A394DBX3_LUPAN|nr:PREDICTED: probable F-box protein At5g04010 [Lupinus angustifolius]XP_019431739.1 PREDICTED: probable F-box protein At5g04010 [Lupinus angustifolius]OIV90452.1 hypothetical protein TanjilG_01930 [Lupinus angustifolius]OIW20788.1 hypothetical protein TanjilG_23168 [Lupinus angustifolius]